MKKNSSVLMAALTLTAIVLGVILLATPQRQAQATMINTQGGVVMMTAGVSGGTDEQLVIMDKSTGKMLVYRLTANGFELVGNADVAAMFSTRPVGR